MRRVRSSVAGLVAGALAITTVALPAAPAPTRARLDREAAVHVLNRLTFGATASTVDALQRTGLDGWLDRQLHPARVDDAALQARLATFRTLAMSPRVLAETYYLPVLQRRRDLARQTTATADADAPSAPEMTDAAMRAQRRALAADLQPVRQVVVELTTQKVVRLAESERQLEEVLVDFWFNHFNVFAGKGPLRTYVADFERTAIRPHVLGSFRDLLGAVAAHPAMLFYLDNWQSSAPRPPRAGAPRRGATGLNENYARELLELHTLGVDGGYTQQDIVEVARAFTGWTIRQPRAGGEAFFDPRRHDAGVKQVLGHTLRDGGQRDGERVLDIVARHPATARHLARKLVVRFVSDTPPEALVARVAARFTATDGDLRATLEALVRSPEFLAPTHRHAKVKTPVEFVASAIRVLDVDVQNAARLGQELRTLGMPPYFAAPPTGYSDRAEAWTNAGALVQRMNLAVALTHGRLPGVSAPQWPAPSASSPEEAARRLAEVLLLRPASDATIATVAQARTAPQMAALLLGSPEFQRR